MNINYSCTMSVERLIHFYANLFMGELNDKKINSWAMYVINF